MTDKEEIVSALSEALKSSAPVKQNTLNNWLMGALVAISTSGIGLGIQSLNETKTAITAVKLELTAYRGDFNLLANNQKNVLDWQKSFSVKADQMNNSLMDLNEWNRRQDDDIKGIRLYINNSSNLTNGKSQ